MATCYQPFCGGSLHRCFFSSFPFLFALRVFPWQVSALRPHSRPLSGIAPSWSGGRAGAAQGGTAAGSCNMAISMARGLCETRTPRAQTTPAKQKLQAKALRVQKPKALQTTHASKNGYGDADAKFSMGYRVCYLLWCCRYAL